MERSPGGDYGSPNQPSNSKLRSIINTNISNRKLFIQTNQLTQSEKDQQDLSRKNLEESHDIMRNQMGNLSESID
jgi:hypothetical protein